MALYLSDLSQFDENNIPGSGQISAAIVNRAAQRRTVIDCGANTLKLAPNVLPAASAVETECYFILKKSRADAVLTNIKIETQASIVSVATAAEATIDVGITLFGVRPDGMPQPYIIDDLAGANTVYKKCMIAPHTVAVGDNNGVGVSKFNVIGLNYASLPTSQNSVILNLYGSRLANGELTTDTRAGTGGGAFDANNVKKLITRFTTSTSYGHILDSLLIDPSVVTTARGANAAVIDSLAPGANITDAAGKWNVLNNQGGRDILINRSYQSCRDIPYVYVVAHVANVAAAQFVACNGFRVTLEEIEPESSYQTVGANVVRTFTL